jgi:hypothetical protein
VEQIKVPGVVETTKNLRVVGFPFEIPTDHFQNSNQEPYPLLQTINWFKCKDFCIPHSSCVLVKCSVTRKVLLKALLVEVLIHFILNVVKILMY